MSVSGLLAEIAKADYAGLSDAEIVAKLNEWQTTYVPCPAKLFNEALAVYSVHGRVEVLREKGTIGDELYVQWKQLLQIIEQGGDLDGKATESLINDLNAVEALGPDVPGQPPPLTRLLDMVRVQSTVARAIYHYDVTEQALVASKERESLRDKIETQRAAVEAEYALKRGHVEAAFAELEKKDGSGVPTGDKDYQPEWEK